MGLLRSLLLLPVKGPLDGVLWVAGQIQDAALSDINDPSTLRKALQDLENDLIAGRISEEAYDEAETSILMRLRGIE
jgi:hypothetical protein